MQNVIIQCQKKYKKYERVQKLECFSTSEANEGQLILYLDRGTTALPLSEVKAIEINKDKKEQERITLRELARIISGNTIICPVYEGENKGGYFLRELLKKKPEFENKIIKENGIEIKIEKLDSILAADSSFRETNIFPLQKKEGYEYLLITLVD